jgi:phosphoribosyl 1,2-cyclic phosphate phosphodiesterase
MRITILGSGTSSGVPMIGCSCPVCSSPDPMNHRTRASVSVHLDAGTILIDTATDLRQQALRWGLTRVDAVLFTHAHADHIHGIDELRSFNMTSLREIPCYGPPEAVSRLRAYFDYIFREDQTESLRPFLTLQDLTSPTELCGVRVVPVPLLHGDQAALGYRLGDFAYLTDASRIPEGSWDLLPDLRLLVLDALRPHRHPTHFSIPEALEVIERLKPRRAVLTHLSHHVDHQLVNKKLPIGVELAYDGQTFELPG